MKSLADFQITFSEFLKQSTKDHPPIGIEIRNANYLNEKYFSFLSEQNLIPVFLEGYYMPPVVEIYEKYNKYILNTAIIRLHGPDRQGIEKIANENWNQIYISRDKEINSIVEMIKDIQKKKVDLFVNVNNHFEGSAPLTIQKIKERIS
jgi:uncharacterized protein YecE (DUF72 family)